MKEASSMRQNKTATISRAEEGVSGRGYNASFRLRKSSFASSLSLSLARAHSLTRRGSPLLVNSASMFHFRHSKIHRHSPLSRLALGVEALGSCGRLSLFGLPAGEKPPEDAAEEGVALLGRRHLGDVVLHFGQLGQLEEDLRMSVSVLSRRECVKREGPPLPWSSP